MRGLEKNRIGRGQTDRKTDIYIYKLASRLLERIGLRADSLKIYGLMQALLKTLTMIYTALLLIKTFDMAKQKYRNIYNLNLNLNNTPNPNCIDNTFHHFDYTD